METTQRQRHSDRHIWCLSPSGNETPLVQAWK
jgi:hypothetical protein